MGKWVRDNGLALTLLTLFLLSVTGQAWSGLLAENEERLFAGESPLTLPAYLSGGQFLSSLFENWESEFLQMWAFVMLTAYLFQRGSPESRDPDGEPDRPGEGKDRPRSPGRWVYEHSLGLALLGLFLASFALHRVNSTRNATNEALEKGVPPPSLIEHLGSARLWFESFQNWQSEFLSTAVLVVFGIFLREIRSTESKAVGDPNSKTGAE